MRKHTPDWAIAAGEDIYLKVYGSNPPKGEHIDAFVIAKMIENHRPINTPRVATFIRDLMYALVGVLNCQDGDEPPEGCHGAEAYARAHEVVAAVKAEAPGTFLLGPPCITRDN